MWISSEEIKNTLHKSHTISFGVMASKVQNKQRTKANTTQTVKFLVFSFGMKLEDQSIDYSWYRQRWRVSLLRKINEPICPTIFLSMLSICQSCSHAVMQSCSQSVSRSVSQSVSMYISCPSVAQTVCQSFNLSTSPCSDLSRTANQSVSQLVH